MILVIKDNVLQLPSVFSYFSSFSSLCSVLTNLQHSAKNKLLIPVKSFGSVNLGHFVEFFLYKAFR